jgi:hypothetical protein
MLAKSISFTLVILQLCSFVWLQRDRGPPDVSLQDRQFRVVYEWRTLDFAFKNEQERGAAIFRGEYIPRNVIISDVKPYGNRLYLVRLINFGHAGYIYYKEFFIIDEIFINLSRCQECFPVHQQHLDILLHLIIMEELTQK